MPAASLTKDEIRRLLEMLASELDSVDAEGEIFLVGGAVMCLALDARPATRDLDAYFRPSAVVREAARRVARKANVQGGWLNDAVKGFLSPHGEFDEYMELPGLRVYVARPEYLLAMKCASMRLGEEFRDLDDVRYLLRYLNVESADHAIEIVGRYFDERHLLPKTRLALEELLPPG